MTIRHRKLYALTTQLFLLSFLTFAASWSGIAKAADNLYDVAKISVDVTAKDAVAARTTGMAEAEARAVTIVLRRLLPPGIDPELPGLTKEDIEGLVNGVSIRNERNSQTRYVASLDISINEQGIKQLLGDYNLPYDEKRAEQISILPLMLSGGTVASEEEEGWRRAWEELDLSHSITPATILRPRPNLGRDTIEAVIAGDAGALAAMQSDYGYGPLVIAVGETAGGAFVTRLAGTDSVGPVGLERSDPIGSDPKATARQAAATAFQSLESRWKMSQSGAPATQANVQPGGEAVPSAGEGGAARGEVARNLEAQVEFSGLKDWQEIRGRLMNVAGIQGLEVNSLSARAASITFNYAGSLDRLQQELGQSGFVLDEREGTFVLRSR
jgi:hypothetical protein